MASTLSAHHLAKAYGGRPVVKDVSLQVSAGEIVGLLGPNGAGKTTCFYMIVGLVEADAGDIRLDDESLMAMPMHRRARAGIGYLPQEASVFRQLSVRDNLLAILETRPELTRKNAPLRWPTHCSRSSMLAIWLIRWGRPCLAANVGESKSPVRSPPSPLLSS